MDENIQSAVKQLSVDEPNIYSADVVNQLIAEIKKAQIDSMQEIKAAFQRPSSVQTVTPEENYRQTNYQYNQLPPTTPQPIQAGSNGQYPPMQQIHPQAIQAESNAYYHSMPPTTPQLTQA